MPSDELVSLILEALYEAPLDPSRWQDFLRLTAEASGGEAAALLLHDFNHVQSMVSRQWGIDPEATRLYEQHYAPLDVWFQSVSTASDWIGTSEHFVPLAELERTEFYNDLVLPCGIPHGMFGMVERRADRIANLSIYRDLRAGAFDEADLKIMRFLKPHIQRAYRLHTELSKAQNRSAGLQAALDTLSPGVVLLGPRMQVVAMNKAAERLVGARNGLLANSKSVCAEQTGESARLQELIAKAVTTGNGAGLETARAFTISRRDLPPLQVLVSPIGGCDLDEGHQVRAIMFVKDPSQRVRPKNETLREMFGLTPAECRVALLLADGHAPTQVAEMIGVGRNTLKSQLASVFRKTGTSRQSQLVRLLSHLPLGL